MHDVRKPGSKAVVDELRFDEDRKTITAGSNKMKVRQNLRTKAMYLS